MTDTQDLAARGDDVPSSDLPTGIHYVDLALGSWRPREAARQLGVSLGIELDLSVYDVPPDSDLAFAAATADVDAGSDPLVTNAWQDACHIAAALPADVVVVVFAPQYDLPLRADNEWFFHFLRRLDRAIVVAGSEPKMRAVEKSPFEPRRNIVLPQWRPLPDGMDADSIRLLRLFPGLLPRQIAEAAGLGRAMLSLISVGGDYLLVPTACRDRDPRDCPFEFDALEDLENEDEGFKAFAQTYCTNQFADVAGLTDLGKRHFFSGSRDLGRDLVARAHSIAPDPAWLARTEILLLEMSLFERRFSEVVSAPQLSPRFPPAEKEKLRYLKHCAQLELGDLSSAPEFVAASLRRLRDTDRIDTADLVRLNSIVRARHAVGDFDGAVTLGHSVAAALAHGGASVDQRFVYANAVSLAGLYAVRGDFPALQREIDRAFSPTLGARSASDILLMNVLRAKAESDQTTEAAAALWLRAGLAWLSLEPLDAIGRDAAEAIVGVGMVNRSRLDSEVSAVLADALTQSWPDIASTPPGRLPEVFPSSVRSANAPRHMYAGPGAAMLWTNETMTAPPPVPERARLIRLVCAAIARLCPPFAVINGGSISADANLGTDIPAVRSEALSVALRLGVQDFCFGDERLKFDAEGRGRLAVECEVRLSPIVSAVTDSAAGLVISFKRYLPNVVLAGADARLVEPLRTGDCIRLTTLPILADGQSLLVAEEKLRILEAKHIVRIEIRPS